MQFRICAVASLLVLPTLAAAPAQAQDTNWLMGSWEIERESPQGTTTTTLEFRQDADSIVGTMSMAMGQRDVALSLTEVRLDGMKVSFKVGPPADGARPERGGRAGAGGGRAGAGERAAGGRAGGAGGGMQQAFAGELKGEVIQGTITTPRGEQPFTARRPSAG